MIDLEPSFPLLRGTTLVQKIQPGFILGVILIGTDRAPAIRVHGRGVLARHHVLDLEVFAVQVGAGGTTATVHVEGICLEAVGQEGLPLCLRLHPGQLCPHEPFGIARAGAEDPFDFPGQDTRDKMESIFWICKGSKLGQPKAAQDNNTTFYQHKHRKTKKTRPKHNVLGGVLLVPVAGIEPARHRWQWILSPPRLPVPTHRRSVHRFSGLHWLLYRINRKKAIEKRISLLRNWLEIDVGILSLLC